MSSSSRNRQQRSSLSSGSAGRQRRSNGNWSSEQQQRRSLHNQQQQQNLCISVKSEYGAEYRRWTLDPTQVHRFDQFVMLVRQVHNLHTQPLNESDEQDMDTDAQPDSGLDIKYLDKEKDLLPINNDDNFAKALEPSKIPYTNRKNAGFVLRLLVLDASSPFNDLTNYYAYSNNKAGLNKRNKASHDHRGRSPITISKPSDFRPVSTILDVDKLPPNHRRVKLMKHGSDRPLGFYIREGISVRLTDSGIEKVYGVFVSKIAPGGLADSAGLLNVDDEILEVNGIVLDNKDLDQAQNMMIANSSNLILTIRPKNQAHTLSASSAAASQLATPQSRNTSTRSHGSSSTHSSSSRHHHNQQHPNNDSNDWRNSNNRNSTNSANSFSSAISSSFSNMQLDDDDDQDEVKEHPVSADANIPALLPANYHHNNNNQNPNNFANNNDYIFNNSPSSYNNHQHHHHPTRKPHPHHLPNFNTSIPSSNNNNISSSSPHQPYMRSTPQSSSSRSMQHKNNHQNSSQTLPYNHHQNHNINNPH